MQVLLWIQENIAAFGGDAGNVTLFGQADGAVTLQALVATPAARGLAHRVIPQSGAYAAQRPESAQLIADFVLKQLGIKAGDLSAFRLAKRAVNNSIRLCLSFGKQRLSPVASNQRIHACASSRCGTRWLVEPDYLTGTCADEWVSAPGIATTAQMRIFANT